MTDDFYKKALDSAVEELSRLTDERDELRARIVEIEERLERLRQGALGLTALAGVDFQQMKDQHPDIFIDQLDPRLGITAAVREVLRTSDEPLTPVEIKERVFQISPAVAGHKNPMASIHAVLRRLMDSDEAILGTYSDDTIRYGWIGSDDAEERIRRWFDNADEILKEMERDKRKKKSK